MQFKINDIENEKFYRYSTAGGILKRVPGSETKLVRISVTCTSRDGVVTFGVRRPTRSAAVAVVKELLCISDVRWATMLSQYEVMVEKREANKALVRQRINAKFNPRVTKTKKRAKRRG